MIKRIDKLMKAIVLIALLFTAKRYMYDLKNEQYFRDTVTESVAPAKVFQRNIGTTFQLAVNGWQYTITNNHICTVYEKYVPVGDEILEILFEDPIHDVCILESSSYRPYLKLAEEEAEINDDVFLVGHPRGMVVTVRKGYLVDKGTSIVPWLSHSMFVGYFTITATSYPGNSGSPVLNSEGDVIGILFAGNRMYSTEGYVVPRRYIIKAIKRYLESE